MSEVFLTVLNLGISASWIVLAVLLLRLLLKKSPKWVSVLLWGIVALRLVFPFSIESVLSLIPSTQVFPPEIMTDPIPQINSGIPILNEVINPVIGESLAPTPTESVNPLQVWVPVLANTWLVGMISLLLYTFISYLRVRSKVKTAVRLRDNIYQCEKVTSPFVLGILFPKIYLPFSLKEKDASLVIAHEQAHIRRKDHLWKPLGFLLLSLHWFNPLMWLAYVLLCRDIELACDEKVVKKLETEDRADYSQALLSCSVNRRTIAACPLAFGEVGVKERVKSVLSYKKPAFWLILLGVVAVSVTAVCLLTSPPAEPEKEQETAPVTTPVTEDKPKPPASTTGTTAPPATTQTPSVQEERSPYEWGDPADFQWTVLEEATDYNPASIEITAYIGSEKNVIIPQYVGEMRVVRISMDIELPEKLIGFSYDGSHIDLKRTWITVDYQNETVNYKDGTVYKGSIGKWGPEGNGKIIYSDGSVYEGGFKNGKRHGNGTFTAGKVYTGQWQNDLQHGKGVEKSSGGGVIYDGEWQNGKYHGQGTFYTRADFSEHDDVFVGEFRYGYMYEGTYTWGYDPVEGSVFTGKMGSSGPSNGTLVFYEMYGNKKFRYEGGFDGTWFSGYGKLTFPSGDVFTGYFKTSYRFKPYQFSAEGVMEYADGAVEVGTWEKGVKVK